MRLFVLAVGAPKDRRMAPAIAEYEKRAGRYFRFESSHVTAGAGPGAAPDEVRAREAERLRNRMPDDLEIWALTRDGDQISSTQLAGILSDTATYGRPGITFLIGGAHGLDSGLVQNARRALSLSRMTLPHDMARLVLVEQIYRAGTLIRGEPYHKAGSR